VLFMSKGVADWSKNIKPNLLRIFRYSISY
jgi:hypothetical protein